MGLTGQAGIVPEDDAYNMALFAAYYAEIILAFAVNIIDNLRKRCGDYACLYSRA